MMLRICLSLSSFHEFTVEFPEAMSDAIITDVCLYIFAFKNFSDMISKVINIFSCNLLKQKLFRDNSNRRTEES